jgi:GNAT superfamily N-acetyltransferase
MGGLPPGYQTMSVDDAFRSYGLNQNTLRDGILALLNERAPGRYWVAERDGRVVGQLLITYEWSDWRNGWFWWIQSVYVIPEFRRKGVYAGLYASWLGNTRVLDHDG